MDGRFDYEQTGKAMLIRKIKLLSGAAIVLAPVPVFAQASPPSSAVANEIKTTTEPSPKETLASSPAEV